MPILPTIQDPADLRGLNEVQLAQLAVEIRDTIVQTVAHTGGHLGSSLGVGVCVRKDAISTQSACN